MRAALLGVDLAHAAAGAGRGGAGAGAAGEAREEPAGGGGEGGSVGAAWPAAGRCSPDRRPRFLLMTWPAFLASKLAVNRRVRLVSQYKWML